jgi:hypothetical protein
MTNDELSKHMLVDVIRELRDCEDLTVREMRSLPTISDAVPAQNPYIIEQMIARLPVAEIERILAMARRYLVPPAVVTGKIDAEALRNYALHRMGSQDYVQVELPQIGV